MEKRLTLTIEEKDCLRLYSGDIRVRDDSGNLLEIKSEDSIWGDINAYKMLNALMFEGTKNEEVRVIEEKTKLNEYFIERIEETIRILLQMYSAMCKYGVTCETGVVGYRIERVASLENLQQGHTISYFSTSKANFQKDFMKKAGIILIEVVIEAGVPCIDYEMVLKGKEYKNVHEKEVLIPPFVSIKLEEKGLNYKEKKLKDMNGNKPIAKYKVVTRKEESYEALTTSELQQKIKCYEYIIKSERIKLAKKYIQDLNEGKEINDENKSEYRKWKENLQSYLKITFKEIANRIYQEV